MATDTTHYSSVCKILTIDGDEYEVTYSREMGSDPSSAIFVEEVDGPDFRIYRRSDCSSLCERLMDEVNACRQEFEEYASIPYQDY